MSRPHGPFVVELPAWDDTRTLRLRYRFHDRLGVREVVHVFDEVVTFDTDVGSRDSEPAADVWTAAVVDLLAVSAGVSYFKAFMPTRVEVDGPALGPAGQRLALALYDEGLRECAVTNGLEVPLVTELSYVQQRAPVDPVDARPDRIVLPFGAGRDSTLVASTLRELDPVLFTVGRNEHADAVAAALGLEIRHARRAISSHLLELNASGAINGHVPVTAVNSLLSVLAAGALGCGEVVMANERASSAPTRLVDGTPVNHQFSKSYAAELLVSAALAEVGDRVGYVSALRPWGDVEIARAFSRLDRELHRSFVSCNRAFRRDDSRRSASWCGECAKCASVFLSLAPWMSPSSLTEIFGDDLLADPRLVGEFRSLLDAGDKPFECVSDVHEAQAQIGRLAVDPSWCDHRVVRELAPLGSTEARAGDDLPTGRDRLRADVAGLLAAALDR